MKTKKSKGKRTGAKPACLERNGSGFCAKGPRCVGSHPAICAEHGCPFFMDAKQQFRDELLTVMWRWANESDITMSEWLETCHDAIETVILRPNVPHEPRGEQRTD